MSEITFDQKGIDHIIKRSQGSMRDALVSFDQTVSFAGKSVSEEQVKEILGITGNAQIASLFDSIISGDVKKIVAGFAEISSKGVDLKIFCRELMEYTRNLAIAKRVSEPHKLIDLQKSELDVVLSQAAKLDGHAIQCIFQGLLKLDLDIKQSSSPALVFEMSLIRLSTLKDLIGIDEILKKINMLESGTDRVPHQQNETSSKERINGTYEAPKAGPAMLNETPPEYSDESCPTGQEQVYSPADSAPGDDKWGIIKDKIGARKPIVGGILENMKVIEIGTSEIVLGYGKKETDLFMEELNSAYVIIKEIITEVMGREMTLVFREPEKGEKKKVNKDNENWKKQIIQNVLDYFPGTVIEHSVHKGV
jgi:DNA polymerase-3 subunit gamma/tau